jgi:phage FluMu protein gp41
MHVKKPNWKSNNGKTYQSVWLCESYRESGKSKTRYVANLKNCQPREIAALEFALAHADDIDKFVHKDKVSLQQGRSVGAVWVVCKTAERLGITKALGQGFQAQLALWQIVARVIEQGSRLSAVRLHEVHALADTIGLQRGFDENDLYENLAWLTENQDKIEERLFKERHSFEKPILFLYDVTSSYLEGDHNVLAAYGYNRDGKKGKKQIVIGLLCDAEGEPLSVQVFTGNTQDVKTFSDQVKKVGNRFGCRQVTFVGDKGMIKSGQIEELSEEGFNYISSLTRAQMETLLREDILQMELFDKDVCEVAHDGVRYVLRRNPYRAEELAATRSDKEAAIKAFMAKQNAYLAEHPRARIEVARRRVEEKIERLKCDRWLRVCLEERTLTLRCDEAALQDMERLDGCYVIRTDLPASEADTDTVHARYKDLAKVESAFRVSKTGHLELRPIYVRSEASTRGHVFVVMLAYIIRRRLEGAWRDIDMTVEEGLDALKTLCCMEMKMPSCMSVHSIPKPTNVIKELIDALEIRMPKALTNRAVKVGTRKKLPERRVSS